VVAIVHPIHPPIAKMPIKPMKTGTPINHICMSLGLIHPNIMLGARECNGVTDRDTQADHKNEPT